MSSLVRFRAFLGMTRIRWPAKANGQALRCRRLRPTAPPRASVGHRRGRPHTGGRHQPGWTRLLGKPVSFKRTILTSATVQLIAYPAWPQHATKHSAPQEEAMNQLVDLSRPRARSCGSCHPAQRYRPIRRVASAKPCLAMSRWSNPPSPRRCCTTSSPGRSSRRPQVDGAPLTVPTGDRV